jgi:hypothetical protein
MHRTTPRDAQEEQRDAGSVEKETEEVKLLDEVPSRVVPLLHVEVRRVVEEVVESGGKGVDDDQKVIAPSPSRGGMENKCVRDGGTEASGNSNPHVHERVHEKPVLDRSEFAQHREERELDCRGQSNYHGPSDNGRDVNRCRTDNVPNQSEDVSTDEEPSASKDVGKAPDNGVSDADHQRIHQADPDVVLIWPKIFVEDVEDGSNERKAANALDMECESAPG